MATRPHVARDPQGPADEPLIYASTDFDDAGRPLVILTAVEVDGLLHLQYADGAEFWITPAGDAVWADWPADMPADDGAAYLLGPVMGLVLRLRGITCLHASAVVRAGRALCFVGESEAGKSTLATALCLAGMPLLTDDILPLGHGATQVMALPGCPRLRLRGTTLQSLAGSGLGRGALPSAPADGARLTVPLPTPSLPFADGAVPIGAVYLLGDRVAAGQAPRSEPVGAAEGLVALIANTYAWRIVAGEQRANEFGVIGELAAQVPIRRLRGPADARDIPDLVACVLADAATLPEPV